GQEKYYDRLQDLVRERHAEEVVFTGQVDDDELRAAYASADLFLCLSEHEGFCVPLLEAMAFEVPVVAFEAGAVRETLHGGGVLLRDKEPSEVATLVHRILTDDALREQVLETQARAMAKVRATDFGALLLDRLRAVLQPGAPSGAAEQAGR
ncbi:MAG TPA: glycosyltransferase, partial [Vicinamibacteria bacterium]|nr:glycosyltransferase [Vicinamibacteria bacterium]